MEKTMTEVHDANEQPQCNCPEMCTLDHENE